MTATRPLITDPALQRVLAAAASAREQTLAILSLIESYHNTARSSASETYALQLALSTQQKQLNAYLSCLRGLNRKAVLGVRSTKQETTEARQEIDALHLQLQNLYYEQRHLRGEIVGCEEYDHAYRRLPMIPVDKFLSQHPEHSSSSEHDLTVARIQDEQVSRQKLDEQRQELQKRKDAMTRDTTAKKEDLCKLDAEIEKWLLGEGNVRKIFDAREKKLLDAGENVS